MVNRITEKYSIIHIKGQNDPNKQLDACQVCYLKIMDMLKTNRSYKFTTSAEGCWKCKCSFITKCVRSLKAIAINLDEAIRIMSQIHIINLYSVINFDKHLTL